tara:strand:+ start:166 stop:408 length:243 start_codon:yes stop_codon:yes gene_type:complete
LPESRFPDPGAIAGKTTGRSAGIKGRSGRAAVDVKGRTGNMKARIVESSADGKGRCKDIIIIPAGVVETLFLPFSLSFVH